MPAGCELVATTRIDDNFHRPQGEDQRRIEEPESHWHREMDLKANWKEDESNLGDLKRPGIQPNAVPRRNSLDEQREIRSPFLAQT